MSHRTPGILSFNDMTKLSNGRLLVYRDSLLKVPEGPDDNGSSRLTKQSPEWRAAYAALRVVMVGRGLDNM